MRIVSSKVVKWAESESSRRLMPMADRLRHVQGVARTVSTLVPGDLDLLAAAWLHDVGYSVELSECGMHALDGAEYLRRTETPDVVISLVAYHTGAEYEAAERGLAEQLARFDRPDQDDLDVLILADLCTGPTGDRVEVADRLTEILRRYEDNHPVHRAVTRSRSYLVECADRAASRFGYPM